MMHFTLGGAAGKRKAAHARSASHPCHCLCHPVHTRLDAGVRAPRAWSASAADGPSGLAHVEAVLAVLGEFLALPQAAAALRDDAAACDRFLTLADAYGSFEQALLALKQSVAQLRAGVRLGDGVMVAASLRARRRAEKELCGLAAAMRHASRHVMLAPADAADGEVTGVVAEAAAATASASEAIFLWCAAMSPDVSALVQTVPVNAWLARLRVVPVAKKAVSLPETATVAAALERLEERIGELESGSEKVFSSLLQARVSLLNIHNTL
ncbi:uncharacterized protein LOC119287101 [Triticum dicoccoides]|uniref:Uncharacterized protein n=1 Tax=Triticum turgidum subsp. durum TaxID=4567 RepID=A0A9R0Q7V5_TRITD|nr:uncharacterized protein LOC119287101 [Triticum dicoccoides]VAH05176.1 unnamed protein product [Triticum turgidum subsp. durum]